MSGGLFFGVAMALAQTPSFRRTMRRPCWRPVCHAPRVVEPGLKYTKPSIGRAGPQSHRLYGKALSRPRHTNWCSSWLWEALWITQMASRSHRRAETSSIGHFIYGVIEYSGKRPPVNAKCRKRHALSPMHSAYGAPYTLPSQTRKCQSAPAYVHQFQLSLCDEKRDTRQLPGLSKDFSHHEPRHDQPRAYCGVVFKNSSVFSKGKGRLKK